MKLYKDKYFLILSLAAGFISLIIYYITKAPTTSFWDCGEFIASSYILGIPHPPGYPLFIIIGRLFTLLPIAGDIAVRVNLISVLSAAASVVVAYWLIIRIALNGSPKIPNGLSKYGLGIGALCGALIMGFSSTFWSSAVEAEVYALAMLLMLLINYLAFIWAENIDRPGNDRLLILISYLLWLSLGVHMTVFLVLIPMILYLAYYDFLKSGLKRWPVWIVMSMFILFAAPVQTPLLGILGIDIAAFELESFACIFVLALMITGSVTAYRLLKRTAAAAWGTALLVMISAVIGFSSQMYIPIRASQKPAINENDPATFNRFKGFLERKQYGQESMITRMLQRRASWRNQLIAHPRFGLLGYFNSQYASPDQKITLYKASDKGKSNGSSSPEFSLSLPIFYILIIGFYGLYESSRRAGPEGSFMLISFLIGTIGLMLYMNFSDGAYNTAIAPIAEVRNRDYFFTPGYMYYGIIIGMGIAMFLQWLGGLADKFKLRAAALIPAFAAAVLVAILLAFNTVYANYQHNSRLGNFIPRDYAENILESCAQNGILFTNGDNDTFPLWYIQEVEKVRLDVRVVNLSLLNTSWYVHQLKDQMNVPISISDDEIDKLQPKRFTDYPGIWRVQDQMVQHIVTNIRNDSWNIPVYFAITVSEDNRLGLDDHLIMEGMALRVVETSGKDRVEPEIGMKVLGNPANFRGIADPSVIKDENDKRLIANYIVAMLKISETYLEQQEPDSAVKIAELAFNLSSDDSPWQSRAYVAKIFALSGEIDRIPEIICDSPEGEKIYLAISQELIMDQEFEAAEKILVIVLSKYPDSFSALNNLAVLYYRDGHITRADSLIDKFRKQFEDNMDIQTSLDQLKEKLKSLPDFPEENK